MLKSLLKTSVYMACLAWSGIANAAGLGGINVTSALGQPLKAEIEVVSVDKADKSSLKAKLASAEAYKNAGLDYPYGITKLKFQIDENANGDPLVRITSAQPVNDPFLTLLVELSWSSGKLMREYTFLLDPVGYKPEQPKAEEVKPIEPVVAEPVVVPVSAPIAASEPAAAETVAEKPANTETTAEAAPAVEPAAESASAAVPVEENAAPAPAATEQPLAQESAPVAAPVETAPAETVPATQDALSKEEAIAEAATEHDQIVVKRGDTLSKIAAQIKPSNVSLERMLVALYRENAGAFDGHNMNRVRTGKILNIPLSNAVEQLPQADAVEEIRAQAADWNAYRQKLSAVHTPTAKTVDKQEVSGKISAAVIDKAAPSKEPAKEVLKLSKGEAPNEKTVTGGKSSIQEKAIAKEEDAIAQNKAAKDIAERTAILEKNVKDMKALADLKKESAPASAPTSAVTLNAASAPQPASAVAAAKPKPKAKIEPPKVVQQPSLTDQLLSEPLYLAGGAAILLAMGGLGYVVVKRRKNGGSKKKGASSDKPSDVGSTTGRITAPVASSPDTGDFTQSAEQPASASASAEPEEVDPIGEADLFLTFGRDAQAEEVLKEALKKNPNNNPVKLKLLSIYANRKDTNSFYSYAREIKESGDESAWEQAVAMGRVLDPSNPFYGGDSSEASAPEAPVGSSTQSVDFDLGFGASAPSPEFGSQSTVVMQSPPSQESTAIMSSEMLRAAAQQATPMDFDITGTNPGVPVMNATGTGLNQDATAALSMDDLVFDVTTTHPQIAAASAPAAEVPAPAAGGMDFMLDFPMDTKAEAPAKAALATPDLGLGDISLNLDKTSTFSGGASAEPKDEHWQEVATKLDLAKAYQEMGDVAGAREILEEVVRDGDAQQRETAQTLMQQL